MKRLKKLAVLGMAATMVVSSTLCASASGLKEVFNAKYYADSYPDLKAAFGNNEEALYQHFINYGLKENRQMNPLIDVQAYRKAYPDLNAAFGDNWDAYVAHYLDHGMKEGRTQGVLFNPLAYAAAYPDVAAAYGSDLAAITEHYLNFGVKEGRTAGVTVKAPTTAPAPAKTSSGGGQTTTPPAPPLTADQQKLKAIKDAAEAALTDATFLAGLSNSTNATAIETAVNTKLTAASLTGVSLIWEDETTKATIEAANDSTGKDGSITGTLIAVIRTANNKTDSVAIPVELVIKSVVTTALEKAKKAVEDATLADTDITPELIKTKLDAAIGSASVTGVTTTWKSALVSDDDFSKGKDGVFKGTLRITHTSSKKAIEVEKTVTLKSDDTITLATAKGKVDTEIAKWKTAATYFKYNEANTNNNVDDWKTALQAKLVSAISDGSKTAVSMDKVDVKLPGEDGSNGSITGTIVLSIAAGSEADAVPVTIPDGAVILSEENVTLLAAVEDITDQITIADYTYTSGDEAASKKSASDNVLAAALAAAKSSGGSARDVKVDWDGNPAVTIDTDSSNEATVKGKIIVKMNNDTSKASQVTEEITFTVTASS